MVEKAAGAKDIEPGVPERSQSLPTADPVMLFAKKQAERAREAESAFPEFNPSGAERDLASLAAYAAEKKVRGSSRGTYHGAPAYPLDEDLLPAGESLGGPLSAPPERARTFEESFAQYRSALYAVQGTLSVAHSLLHNEIMRTPCGGVAWKNLGALCDRLSEVSETLRGEIARVPEEGGLVE